MFVNRVSYSDVSAASCLCRAAVILLLTKTIIDTVQNRTGLNRVQEISLLGLL